MSQQGAGAIYLDCDVIKPHLVQAWFVYFSLSIQPLFSNFEKVELLSDLYKIATISVPPWSPTQILYLQSFEK